jgi:hypothetical protein
MKIASSWWFQGKKKRHCFSVGIGSIIALVFLGNALDGSLRVLSQIEPHDDHHGRSLLFPSQHHDTISHIGLVHDDDPYLDAMLNDTRLVRSAQHQFKFFARCKEINDTLKMFFPRDVLFPTTTTWWAAFNINKEWGYVRK